MNILLDYRLYVDRLIYFDTRISREWRNAKSVDELKLDFFYGDLIFRCRQAVFDHDDIPLLWFGYEMCHALVAINRKMSIEISESLMEWDDRLWLIPQDDYHVEIIASYSMSKAVVLVCELKQALMEFNAKLLHEIEQLLPDIKDIYVYGLLSDYMTSYNYNPQNTP